MGWTELKRYEDKLLSLNSSLYMYEDKIKIQSKRKGEIEDLINLIKNVYNSYSLYINNNIQTIGKTISCAVEGVDSISNIEEEVGRDIEKDIYDDYNTGNALLELEYELRDLDNNITEYLNKISSINNDIIGTKNAIRSEQRRIAHMYKADYDEANWKYIHARDLYRNDPTNPKLYKDCNDARIKRDETKDKLNQYMGWL